MDGILRIDRIVGEFDVWLDESFPFAKMKVKVLNRACGDFLAVTNLGVRSLTTGERDGIAGLGDSADEAVSDLLIRFVSLVRENTPEAGLTASDFEWSEPEDF